MKYKSEQHKKMYNLGLERSHKKDSDHKSFCYLAGLLEDSDKLNDIFDFDKDRIRPEGIYSLWQTGASRRLTRLAFNLYTGEAPTALDLEGEEKEDELLSYTVEDIFCDVEDIEYMFEAIRIHYNRHKRSVNKKDRNL